MGATAGVSALFLATMFGASAFAADRLVPFDEFIGSVRNATAASFMTAADAKVASSADFAEMRQHILNMYSGVHVRRSFLQDSQVYDCVPFAEQPSARRLGVKDMPTPPPLPPELARRASAVSDAAPATQPGATEAPGLSCEAGAIPMQRITLEQLSRFHNMREFFQKEPGASPNDLLQRLRAVQYTHKYAHAYQNVANFGGTSVLGLWKPPVNTAKQEIFSLSQHWYVNFVGNVVQTVEGGWQNFPQMYGANKSALFIYWTADGYNKTGCYNLTCPAFVQTNKNIFLGGTFNNYSVVGGQQYRFQLTWWLTGGRWWMYYGNTAVGYYPASQYGTTGMARSASEIDYGGETVGATIWPPMGSGKFAAQGKNKAASHTLIGYVYDTAGHVRNAALKASQPSPACYTDQMHNNSGSAWKSYFFFGGPGGTGC